MGAGKSKLLRKLIEYYTDSSNFIETKTIPLMINYINFVNIYSYDVNKAIEDILKNYHASFDKEYTYLLLIDGFDEKLSEDFEEQIVKLNELSRSLKDQSNIKIIITSRDIKYLTKAKINSVLCKRLEIAPLTNKRTIQFLEKLCKSLNTSSRILEDLKRSSLMRQLPKRPIAAILLAKLLDENSKELPSNMTELYSKYLELMMGRWDIEKGINSDKEYQVAEKIIMLIAEHYIDNNLISISKQECYSFFHDYISSRNISIKSEELFDKILKRSNILIYDHTNTNIYFAHRTFAEYYYAKSKLLSTKLEINEKAFEMYWMNIYFFYVGLQGDCPVLLQELADYTPDKESNKWMKLINMSNYYLAGFTSPYSIVENNLYRIMVDAAQMYKEIIKKKSTSPLSALSEIQLLWWVQMIVKDSYSYEYFAKAIDSTMMRIEESKDISDEIKSYALFFAVVTSFKLGNNDAFNYFFETHKSGLPVNLQFALFYESRNVKEPSTIVKKQIKHIQDKLKSIPMNIIDILHERPISPSIKKIT